MFFAAIRKHSELLSILLQLGADVDQVNASGWTPLGLCYKPELFAQMRLLLEWGAEISNSFMASKDEFIEMALECGNGKLVNLITSEFGGRRCEIISLSKRQDLNGSTCVVENHLPDKGRYKVIFEASKEAGLVAPGNLKRRDRTPDDCGYYIAYKNGRTTRHEFASKEECQAFAASLTEGVKPGLAEVDKSEDVDAEAVARAEQAAESLLAELNIDSSADSDARSKRKGKKKGKKKKGRK